jgi:hypothetical protein
MALPGIDRSTSPTRLFGAVDHTEVPQAFSN